MLLTTIINPVETPTRWDEATVATLKELWAKGWSGTDIAWELGNGHTRNSIIGKVHRLGFHTSVRRMPKPRGVRAVPDRSIKVKPHKALAPVRQKARPAIPVAPYVPLPQIETARPGIALLEFTEHTCKWPIYGNDAEPSERLFCGAEPVEHSSYCGSHNVRSRREVAAK